MPPPSPRWPKIGKWNETEALILCVGYHNTVVTKLPGIGESFNVISRFSRIGARLAASYPDEISF